MRIQRMAALARGARVSAFLAAICLAALASAGARPPLRELRRSAQDPARAASAVALADSLRCTDLSAQDRKTVLMSRVMALLTLDASADSIAVWADSAAVQCGIDSYEAVFVYEMAAGELARRKEHLDWARPRIESLLTKAAADSEVGRERPGLLEARAYAQFGGGALDSAIATAGEALRLTPDNDTGGRQSRRWLLASVYKAKGQLPQATRYLMQLTGGLDPDTSRAGELRKLWIQQKGSLTGLEDALAAEHQAELRRTALELARTSRKLPTATFTALDGTPISTESLRGRVAVLEFWSTTCRPCLRYGLPALQRLQDRLDSRRVVFLTVAAEYQPEESDAQRKALQKFVKENGYTLPTVLDPGGTKCGNLGIATFPTTWIIDRRGIIRFQTVGATPATEEIVAKQIAALAPKAGASAPR